MGRVKVWFFLVGIFWFWAKGLVYNLGSLGFTRGFFVRLFISLCLLLVSACGGGGGGGGGSGGSASNTNRASSSSGATVASVASVASPPINLDADESPPVVAQSAQGFRGTGSDKGAEEVYKKELAKNIIQIAVRKSKGNGNYIKEPYGDKKDGVRPRTRWLFPNKRVIEYREAAGEITGAGVVIGVIDDMALGYVESFKTGVEEVLGKDVFAPTPTGPKRGFEHFVTPENPGDHGIFVTLSALSVAPLAQIYFQNTSRNHGVSAIYEDMLKTGDAGERVYKNASEGGPHAPDVINLSMVDASPMTRYRSDPDDVGVYTEEKLITDEVLATYLNDNAEVQKIVELARQVGVAEADKTIFVFPGGNNVRRSNVGGDGYLHGDSANTYNDVDLKYAGLPLLDNSPPENNIEEVWLAVVGVDGDNNLASQICGRAKDWCLAAPFKNYGEEGNSFAAPMVAGAFALGIQKFKKNPADGTDAKGNVAIRQRLLDTANKRLAIKGYYYFQTVSEAFVDGEVADWDEPFDSENGSSYSYAHIYGHGILDVAAFLEPWGAESMSATSGALGAASPPTMYLLDDTAMVSAPLFGDGVAKAFEGEVFAAFDELHFPFYYSMSRLARNHQQADYITRFSQRGLAPMATTASGYGTRYKWANGSSAWYGNGFGMVENRHPSLLFGFHRDGTFGKNMGGGFVSDAFKNPFFAITPYRQFATPTNFAASIKATERVNLMAFHTPQNSHQEGNRGGAMEYSLSGLDNASFQLGILSEDSRQLGTLGSGGFTSDGATSYFFGFSKKWELAKDLTLLASGYGGVSKFEDTPLMQFEGDVVSSSFSLGLLGDGWAGTLFQPLRAERADATLTYAYGSYPDDITTLRIKRKSTSITPTGRELALELRRFMPSQTLGGTLNIATIARHQPNHQREADPIWESLIYFAKEF